MEALLLARHGFAGSNRDGAASCSVPGDGLTPEGVEQARALGAALADEPIDLGVASELARTQETLELALAGRDVARLVVPELNEIDFGGFDGGQLVEYRAWAAAHPPDLGAPGGERAAPTRPLATRGASAHCSSDPRARSSSWGMRSRSGTWSTRRAVSSRRR